MRVLSIDIGGTVGRVNCCSLINGKLEIEEISRFDNNAIKDEHDTLRWDMQNALLNIHAGLNIALNRYKDIASIGITAWGVDYGYIDDNGNLIENPICYRDIRNVFAMEEVLKKVDYKSLYFRTGIQKLPFNTIFQFYDDWNRRSYELKNASRMLMISDLIAFDLTNKRRLEITNLSTSGLVSLNTGKVSSAILSDINIPDRIFANMIRPGEMYGYLKPDFLPKNTNKDIPVFAVCSHDTSSAILGTPLDNESIYISSGSLSMIGVERDTPIINSFAMSQNFSNELGYENKINFLKNTKGMFIVNELRNDWKIKGEEVDYERMQSLIEEVPPLNKFIDIDSPIFDNPRNMKYKLGLYLRETNQSDPAFKGQWLTIIFKSMAYKYRSIIENLTQLNPERKLKKIYIVGGATYVPYLCQYIANATHLLVYAGPSEATSLGSAIVQYISLGKIKNKEEGRKIISDSFEFRLYHPENNPLYNDEYQDYLKVIGK